MAVVTARELAPTLFEPAPIDEKRVFEFERENGLDQQAIDDATATGKSTDLCEFYVKGVDCAKGKFCQFRHGRNDNLVVCKHWLRGLCKMNEFCRYLHEFDMSKMPECQFFSKDNECTNAECMYRHVDPEKKKSECPYYNRGFCRHGAKCRHRHVRKEPCVNYLRGFCKDGPNCAFGHPKFEISKLDDDGPYTGGGVAMPSLDPTGGAAVPPGPGVMRRGNPAPPPGLFGDAGPVPPIGTVEPVPGVVCHHCQRPGHIRPQCPSRHQTLTQ